mmetsp:Transcript_128872/g.412699  ORF Transcript_128872/g.412699 Transcript_128872/m.412699 type:complete len:218 (+) Transcript_128872:3433-4086(+)
MAKRGRGVLRRGFFPVCAREANCPQAGDLGRASGGKDRHRRADRHGEVHLRETALPLGPLQRWRSPHRRPGHRRGATGRPAPRCRRRASGGDGLPRYASGEPSGRGHQCERRRGCRGPRSTLGLRPPRPPRCLRPRLRHRRCRQRRRRRRRRRCRGCRGRRPGRRPGRHGGRDHRPRHCRSHRPRFQRAGPGAAQRSRPARRARSGRRLPRGPSRRS